LTLANELRNAGMPVPNLDLGGGVGVDYKMAGLTDFTAYGKLVERLFKDQGFTLDSSRVAPSLPIMAFW
jgi:diaminopimelate decarboxylase